jgi:hypothetical protein
MQGAASTKGRKAKRDQLDEWGIDQAMSCDRNTTVEHRIRPKTMISLIDQASA